MTSDQYRDAIDRLGLTQAEAAKMLGVALKQSQRWANGHARVHPCARKLLRTMLAGKLTPDDVRRL